MICDSGFVRCLMDLSKEKKIPAQLEILEGGGTDTCSMQVAGCGSRATAISVPTRYIHSNNNETISKKDYDACVALTVALLEKGSEPIQELRKKDANMMGLLKNWRNGPKRKLRLSLPVWSAFQGKIPAKLSTPSVSIGYAKGILPPQPATATMTGAGR